MAIPWYASRSDRCSAGLGLEHVGHKVGALGMEALMSFYSKVVELELSAPSLEEVKFLGHVILAEGITVDPAKVESVLQWECSRTVTDIRSFVGLAGYYMKFIKGFSKIVMPLTQLARKDYPFIWTDA
ncbi:uncharacterized protein LOC109792459 [Cajanus cajan]|uniref:uncharacterized protein LOC109792459 n=1 Tax=Cajanus cajan TaxID=3821 RepID=UPI00098DB5BE|nr:uncharacterized protein LOC109792459 [Cajanus cajan]